MMEQQEKRAKTTQIMSCSGWVAINIVNRMSTSLIFSLILDSDDIDYQCQHQIINVITYNT
jgi:hypothetical protein